MRSASRREHESLRRIRFECGLSRQAECVVAKRGRVEYHNKVGDVDFVSALQDGGRGVRTAPHDLSQVTRSVLVVQVVQDAPTRTGRLVHGQAAGRPPTDEG